MRIDPVTIGYPMWDITPLLPTVPSPPKSIIDIFPRPQNINDLFTILMNKLKMEMILIQLKGIGVKDESE